MLIVVLKFIFAIDVRHTHTHKKTNSNFDKTLEHFSYISDNTGFTFGKKNKNKTNKKTNNQTKTKNAFSEQIKTLIIDLLRK